MGESEEGGKGIGSQKGWWGRRGGVAGEGGKGGVRREEREGSDG